MSRWIVSSRLASCYPSGGRVPGPGESGYTPNPGESSGSTYGQQQPRAVNAILEHVKEAYDSGHGP
jgi:hypothetical protein